MSRHHSPTRTAVINGITFGLSVSERTHNHLSVLIHDPESGSPFAAAIRRGTGPAAHSWLVTCSLIKDGGGIRYGHGMCSLDEAKLGVSNNERLSKHVAEAVIGQML